MYRVGLPVVAESDDGGEGPDSRRFIIARDRGRSSANQFHGLTERIRVGHWAIKVLGAIRGNREMLTPDATCRVTILIESDDYSITESD